ncbi:hypothetical protein B9G69_009665 [Bdellovibrio sp. SKB1291214]|uniref:hypothetical protein n=1 Tax=Bdellovibrio sp. SKB1291214 TaxID=1732569 RepID=UPI000B51D852|nr:hypothetical protein [Bdellovibrio sp. SKB1291214]UYL07312.1 hypothetical protein B9G69_009665 [Bdellovibrio sp. SKB1291214]
MKNIIAALTITIASSITMAQTQSEGHQAFCVVKSSTGNANVIIDLHQDYRYWIGSKEFEAAGVSGSIEIMTWSGAREQVAQNTFAIDGVTLQNAGMKASVSTGNVSYSIDCRLK